MEPYDLSKFSGVTVAMNACYDEKGEINPSVIRKLARHYLDVGITGLYIGGSTGEGLLQSAEERKLVLETVLNEIRGKMTVIAHIGAPSTRESVELAIHAEAAGADALSAVPSIYYRISEEGVGEHWERIIKSSSLPFIMYYIPQTTGFQVSPALLQRMLRNRQVIGMKITTESTYELQRFKVLGGERFLVFNGPDEQYLAGRLMGADGGIGGTYGVMPELYLRLEHCIATGMLGDARQWQYKINEIIGELLQLPLYAACKEILGHQGFLCGQPRSPLERLTEEGRGQAFAIHEKIGRYTAEAKQETEMKTITPDPC